MSKPQWLATVDAASKLKNLRGNSQNILVKYLKVFFCSLPLCRSFNATGNNFMTSLTMQNKFQLMLICVFKFQS